jgi:ATP-dependent Clp protease ATP-binding subunit ClpA
MGHGSIETEHVLLALFDDQNELVAGVFADLGITSEQVRARVKERLGSGSGEVNTGQMPFGPVAKKMLELGLREALSMGHQQVGPEHLLLGIVGAPEAGASQVLAELGVEAGRVRALVAERLPSPAGGAPVTKARLREARTGQVPSIAFTAVPDAALTRVLMGGAGIALSEQRTTFDIADVLRASLRDVETLRRISRLGLDLGPIRARFEEEPPAA